MYLSCNHRYHTLVSTPHLFAEFVDRHASTAIDIQHLEYFQRVVGAHDAAELVLHRRVGGEAVDHLSGRKLTLFGDYNTTRKGKIWTTN